MGLFRRESLHERLAREGGLVEPSGVRPAWDEAGIHGVPQARGWDLVATVAASGVGGGGGGFWVVPDGARRPAGQAGGGTVGARPAPARGEPQPAYPRPR